MHSDRTDDALADVWTLHPDDLSLLTNKSGATRLGFALLLKFFQYKRAPRQPLGSAARGRGSSRARARRGGAVLPQG